MIQITQLTADPSQHQTFVLPDGTQIDITIQYKDRVLGWFITNLTYGSFTITNYRIVNSPNMLYQFKNQIPFGLQCLTTDGQEITTIQDFELGRASLFILTAAEVQQYAEFLSGS